MFVLNFVCHSFNSRITRQDLTWQTLNNTIDVIVKRCVRCVHSSPPLAAERTRLHCGWRELWGRGPCRSLQCLDSHIFSPRKAADSDLRSANACVIVCNLGSTFHPHLKCLPPSCGLRLTALTSCLPMTAEFYDLSEGITKMLLLTLWSVDA